MSVFISSKVIYICKVNSISKNQCMVYDNIKLIQLELSSRYYAARKQIQMQSGTLSFLPFIIRFLRQKKERENRKTVITLWRNGKCYSGKIILIIFWFLNLSFWKSPYSTMRPRMYSIKWKVLSIFYLLATAGKKDKNTKIVPAPSYHW